MSTQETPIRDAIDIDASPILIPCEQGTPEWFAARVGATTASTFSIATELLQKDSTTKDSSGNPVRRKGDPSAKNEELAGATAMEIISEEPYGDTFQTFAMKRGSEEEWKARAAYSLKYDVEIFEAGVVLTHDRQFGYSTDGEVDGGKGGIEIKTPLNCGKIIDMLKSGDTAEYDHQIQGGMWIKGWEWVDFIMWMPSLRKVSNELYVKRIYRDQKFIDAMEVQLLAHRQRVNDLVAFFSIPHSERPGVQRPDSVIDVVARDIVVPGKTKLIAPPAEAPIEGLGALFGK